ncbi:ras-related protein Rab-37 isoform X4 [Pieris brassicae]|uniref:ras-related protein Rab-37 isoform X4 n=1 Tax=Pieris brassicae TaxID=7116 RepID=UPI001E661E2B|nr:ras-related protein Rab-37 isoform X4 [Pieris brassicae]
MWNPNSMDHRQMEKRVIVGRVRPTWARNLPKARDDDDRSDVSMMPQSDPPSPSEQWDKHGKLDDKYDVFGKVMLLGDSGVGKTCMLVRFRDGTFLAGNYISTVGIDFRNKVVAVDGIKVKLQIWDTAGQERFRSVTHAYYRDAHGNKSDSGLERAVRREEGQRLAREYQVAFMETSAKTGLNVEAAFAHVARALVVKADPADPARLAVRAQPSQEQRSSCPPCS